MRLHDPARRFRLAVLALGAWGLTYTGFTQAQELPLAPAPPAGPSREAELEDRIRQLEAMVQQLSGRVEQMSIPAPVMPPGRVPYSGLSSGSAAGGGDPSSSVTIGPTTLPSSSRYNLPASNRTKPLDGAYGPGFQLSTPDDEYQFEFHNLTQFDGRFYGQEDQRPLRDSFLIPRQWFIFRGRLTKTFDYQVIPSFQFDNVNLLDAFLNVHVVDDRFQVKLGRYKTPFTYEFYHEDVFALANPERSLFFNNFGLNRDLGIMAWGSLFDRRLEYAAGIFNGSRNSFVDTNDSKDVAAYLNFRPFGDQTGSALENFNIGGSVDFGNQLNPTIPRLLRLDVPTFGAAIAGVPFLQFNPNVREVGDRALWSVHAAYYYEQLSLIAEWQSGFQDYASFELLMNRTNVPIQSYYVQAGYFLTGETVGDRRGLVKPLRPVSFHGDEHGHGAIEIAGRYNYLDIDNIIFTGNSPAADFGLADPNRWTNRVGLIDLGVNWYLTEYVKFYLGWQHAEFGDPVLVNPGGPEFQDPIIATRNARQLTSDMFWLRTQIAF